jgi:hypothetical protein
MHVPCSARFGNRAGSSLLHSNDWTCSGRVFQAGILYADCLKLSQITVPAWSSRFRGARGSCMSKTLLYPCSHRPYAALPGRLVDFKANTLRTQWNDAICATLSDNSATLWLRGSCHAPVAPWCRALEVSTVRKCQDGQDAQGLSMGLVCVTCPCCVDVPT